MKAYIPKDVWYDLTGKLNRVEKTGYVDLPDNPHGVPPVHIRGNSIVPTSSSKKLTNTQYIRNEGINLVVIPGLSKTACGDFFWDDGDSIDTIENKKYNYYSFELKPNCSLDINVLESGYQTKQMLNSIDILGTKGDGVIATLDGKPVDGKVTDGTLVFHLNIDLKSKQVGQKWTLNWSSKETKACNIA